MIAVAVVYLVFLYAAGRRHRELQRARADHPAARHETADSESTGASEESSNRPAPHPGEALESERAPSRLNISLREIIEYAAGTDSDGTPLDISGDTTALIESCCSKAVSAKRYRSGLVLEHRDELVYLAIVLWDGRSKTPADRTADRLAREFAESGCPTMAVLTDAPRSYCRANWKFERTSPYLIPAEGIKHLIEGLEHLDRT